MVLCHPVTELAHGSVKMKGLILGEVLGKVDLLSLVIESLTECDTDFGFCIGYRPLKVFAAG